MDSITDGGVGEVIEEPVQHEHRREGQPSEGEDVVEGNLDNSLLLSPEIFHFKNVKTKRSDLLLSALFLKLTTSESADFLKYYKGKC